MAKMPSHVLLGVKQAKQTKTKKSKEIINTLAQYAKDQLKEPPQDQPLEPEQIWTGFQDAGAIKYRNRMFGLSLQVPDGWLARTTGYQNNSAAIFIKPPTKKGLAGSVSSTILCLAHQAQPGEGIADFTSKILDPRYSFEEAQSNLDWDGVKAYQGKADDLYSDEAGANNYLIAFSRKAPEQPGILLEFPVVINKPDSETGISYYQSQAEYNRLPGEIYYLLILDTTESVFQESKEEFDLILRNLIVE
jgi:hypothetical protein